MLARQVSSCWLLIGLLILVSAFGRTGQSFGQPLPFKVDVMCGAAKIGEFEITTYEVWGDGVEIDGCFNKTGDCPCCEGYRFLQIVYLIDDMPLEYPGGGTPPVPFIDTPKGGYLGQPFDFDPWYNEPGDTNPPACEYPFYFYDGPNVKMLKALAERGDNRVRFETWVVCYRHSTKRMCGLAHIRWGYDRVAGVVTPVALDGATHLTDAQINTALANGLFPEWTFSSDIGFCSCTRCQFQHSPDEYGLDWWTPFPSGSRNILYDFDNGPLDSPHYYGEDDDELQGSDTINVVLGTLDWIDTDAAFPGRQGLIGIDNRGGAQARTTQIIIHIDNQERDDPYRKHVWKEVEWFRSAGAGVTQRHDLIPPGYIKADEWGREQDLGGGWYQGNYWYKVEPNPPWEEIMITYTADPGEIVMDDFIHIATECVVPEEEVPTLSEWALVLLGLLLVTGGTIVLARRRAAA